MTAHLLRLCRNAVELDLAPDSDDSLYQGDTFLALSEMKQLRIVRLASKEPFERMPTFPNETLEL